MSRLVGEWFGCASPRTQLRVARLSPRNRNGLARRQQLGTATSPCVRGVVGGSSFVAVASVAPRGSSPAFTAGRGRNGSLLRCRRCSIAPAPRDPPRRTTNPPSLRAALCLGLVWERGWLSPDLGPLHPCSSSSSLLPPGRRHFPGFSSSVWPIGRAGVPSHCVQLHCRLVPPSGNRVGRVIVTTASRETLHPPPHARVCS